MRVLQQQHPYPCVSQQDVVQPREFLSQNIYKNLGFRLDLKANQVIQGET